MIEEFPLSRGGRPETVNAFHRFVYGFDSAALPDLWPRDDPGHGRADPWAGAFWDSPDLWVHNTENDGADHQPPESGQDNWFYARMRNRGAGAARHFAVMFHVRIFVGTQSEYPTDFLPASRMNCGYLTSFRQCEDTARRLTQALLPRSQLTRSNLTTTQRHPALAARGEPNPHATRPALVAFRRTPALHPVLRQPTATRPRPMPSRRAFSQRTQFSHRS